jgi:hypothetical protein
MTKTLYAELEFGPCPGIIKATKITVTMTEKTKKLTQITEKIYTPENRPVYDGDLLNI